MEFISLRKETALTMCKFTSSDREKLGNAVVYIAKRIPTLSFLELSRNYSAKQDKNV